MNYKKVIVNYNAPFRSVLTLAIGLVIKHVEMFQRVVDSVHCVLRSLR